jgi:hypothetical protein
LRQLQRRAAYVASLVGLVLFGSGLYLFVATKTPGPLGIAFAVAGFGEAVCSYYTVRSSRLAWAFLCAQNGLFAVVFLLAAPKIESEAGVSVWVALIPCAVFSALTLVFSRTGADPG